MRVVMHAAQLLGAQKPHSPCALDVNPDMRAHMSNGRSVTASDLEYALEAPLKPERCATNTFTTRVPCKWRVAACAPPPLLVEAGLQGLQGRATHQVSPGDGVRGFSPTCSAH